MIRGPNSEYDHEDSAASCNKYESGATPSATLSLHFIVESQAAAQQGSRSSLGDALEANELEPVEPLPLPPMFDMHDMTYGGREAELSYSAAEPSFTMSPRLNYIGTEGHESHSQEYEPNSTLAFPRLPHFQDIAHEWDHYPVEHSGYGDVPSEFTENHSAFHHEFVPPEIPPQPHHPVPGPEEFVEQSHLYFTDSFYREYDYNHHIGQYPSSEHSNRVIDHSADDNTAFKHDVSTPFDHVYGPIRSLSTNESSIYMEQHGSDLTKEVPVHNHAFCQEDAAMHTFQRELSHMTCNEPHIQGRRGETKLICPSVVPDESQTLANGKKPRHVGKACIHCKKAHLACDEARPCKRCVRLGKTDCVDVEHKRRGRPRSVNKKTETKTKDSIEKRRQLIMLEAVLSEEDSFKSSMPRRTRLAHRIISPFPIDFHNAGEASYPDVPLPAEAE